MEVRMSREFAKMMTCPNCRRWDMSTRIIEEDEVVRLKCDFCGTEWPNPFKQTDTTEDANGEE